jgi:ABC-type polysaccharide/polyol phosphate export permease
VILTQTLLALWVAVLLATLYVFVRDTAHLWQVGLRILFFITPIFYGVSAVPEGLAARILVLNPLTHLIAASRALIIGQAPFPAAPLSLLLIITALWSGVALAVFKRHEATLTEHL